MIDDRGVEQLVARQAHNLEVACSSPASATNNDIASCKATSYVVFFVLGCVKVNKIAWNRWSRIYTKECVFVYFSAYDPARGIMTRKRYYITDNLSISAK